MAKSKKSTKVDPLDSVRLSNPAESEVSAEITPDLPPEVPGEPKGTGTGLGSSSKLKAPPPKPKVPKVGPPPVIRRWRVDAMKRMCVRGQMCTFKLGKVISENSHGAGIIKMLEGAGVPMTEIDEKGKPVPVGKKE